MRLILKPRPVSIWLEPIEVGVLAAMLTSVAVLFLLVRINKRVRRVERLITTL